MTDMMVTPESLDAYLDKFPPPEAMHGAEVTVPEPWQKGEYEPDDPRPDEEVQPESPEFLDIARSAIQTMKRGGWDPKTWQDLILGLHRHMGVDAGFLDIQLTTHVGRTVLDQCGLIGIAPPDMMSFEFLNNPPPGKPQQPPLMDGELHPSLGEPGEGSMGFGKAHGWEDE